MLYLTTGTKGRGARGGTRPPVGGTAFPPVRPRGRGLRARQAPLPAAAAPAHPRVRQAPRGRGGGGRHVRLSQVCTGRQKNLGGEGVVGKKSAQSWRILHGAVLRLGSLLRTVFSATLSQAQGWLGSSTNWKVSSRYDDLLYLRIYVCVCGI